MRVRVRARACVRACVRVHVCVWMHVVCVCLVYCLLSLPPVCLHVAPFRLWGDPHLNPSLPWGEYDARVLQEIGHVLLGWSREDYLVRI